MISGLTVKQEAFATAYIENGGNASAAYRAAYNAENMQPQSIHVNACKLLSDAKVSLRVEELRAALAKRHEITADTITRMLIEDRDFARELESAAAATTATMGLAKLHGLLVDRQHHSGAINLGAALDALDGTD